MRRVKRARRLQSTHTRAVFRLAASRFRPHFDPRRRSWPLIGVAVLVATVRQVGWSEIRAGLRRVGRVVRPRRRPRRRAVPGAGPGLDDLRCARSAPARCTTPRAFAAGMAADAVGNLTPLGLLASEPTKVLLLRGVGADRPGADLGRARQRVLHRLGGADARRRRVDARAAGRVADAGAPRRRSGAGRRSSPARWPRPGPCGGGRRCCRGRRSAARAARGPRGAHAGGAAATSRRASTAWSGWPAGGGRRRRPDGRRCSTRRRWRKCG